MEWSQTEAQFILDHKSEIESKNIETVFENLVNFSNLRYSQIRHLALGLAIVFNLEIIYEVKPSYKTMLFIKLPNKGLGNRLKITRIDYTKDAYTNVNVVYDLKHDLKDFNCSENLISQVLSRMKVEELI